MKVGGSKKQRRAVPFVITMAVLPACGSSQPEPVHPNPPGPDPTVHQNPPVPTTTATPTSTPVATDPPKNVRRSPDGKCWENEEVHCPPGATCNPPPPRQVPCP